MEAFGSNEDSFSDLLDVFDDPSVSEIYTDYTQSRESSVEILDLACFRGKSLTGNKHKQRNSINSLTDCEYSDGSAESNQSKFTYNSSNRSSQYYEGHAHAREGGQDFEMPRKSRRRIASSPSQLLISPLSSRRKLNPPPRYGYDMEEGAVGVGVDVILRRRSSEPLFQDGYDIGEGVDIEDSEKDVARVTNDLPHNDSVKDEKNDLFAQQQLFQQQLSAMESLFTEEQKSDILTDLFLSTDLEII